MVWYSHLLKNFPQFLVIQTVKVFSVVNEAELDALDAYASQTETTFCPYLPWKSSNQWLKRHLWLLSLLIAQVGHFIFFLFSPFRISHLYLPLMVGKPGCGPLVNKNRTILGGSWLAVFSFQKASPEARSLGSNCSLGLIRMSFGNKYVLGTIFSPYLSTYTTVWLTSSASLAWGAFTHLSCGWRTEGLLAMCSWALGRAIRPVPSA